MIDQRLEEGWSDISHRKPGINSGSKLKHHTHIEVLARMLRFTEKHADCWIWKGAHDGSGYGMIQFRAKSVRAHRLIFRIHYGPIDCSLCVLHHCDTPACVNPAHLFAGTKMDNSNDCVAKGRTARGSQIGIAKLSESQAKQILNCKLQRFDRRIGKLAKQFGVSVRTIQAVRDRAQWKYLQDGNQEEQSEPGNYGTNKHRQ